MVELLAILGIMFVGYAIWADNENKEKRVQELDEFKKVRKDLQKAQEDVQILLKQLEQTSEKIVTEVTEKLNEMRVLESKMEAQVELAPLKSSIKIEEYKSNTSDPKPYIDGEADNQKSSKSTVTHKRNNRKINQNMSEGKTIMFPKTKKETHDGSETNYTPKQMIVYAMDKLGSSEDDIAKHLNIGKGEVRLMLELKRKGEEQND